MYTGSVGNSQFTDKNPWGTHYNYDNPEFQQTIGWFFSLIEKGYTPSLAAITGQSSGDLYGAGKYAMITNGSWMINQMYSYKGVETEVAPTPIGPSGKRASMYNGLADSIWVGIEEQAGSGQVGRVPRLAGLPEHRRREGRRLPGDPGSD